MIASARPELEACYVSSARPRVYAVPVAGLIATRRRDVVLEHEWIKERHDLVSNSIERSKVAKLPFGASFAVDSHKLAYWTSRVKPG